MDDKMMAERDEALQRVEELRNGIAGVFGGLAMIREGLETGRMNPFAAAEFLQAILTTKEYLTASTLEG